MKDFNYYAPTQVVFGAQAEEKTGRLVKKYGGTRVLIHYGGQSAERSGVLQMVCDALDAEGIAYVKLGGVVPNPRVSLVRKGIDICRSEGINFILAVGGGSVIDSSKAISVGVPYGGDVWDFYTRKAFSKECLPIGVVLTIPAAGSEMSNGSVITNEEGWLKKDYCIDEFRPRFAVMNPIRTYTLPAWQTACGATDIMMHTMERYFSHDDDMEITDAIAEAVLRTVKESVKVVLADPENYRHRAQIMWAGSLAHNDLTGCGTTGDWATHNIEHELSGLFDVSHGAGLAAIWGSWARYVMDENVARFARFAVNVLGVEATPSDDKATALKGVEAMEQFYRSIGMPICVHELIGRDLTDDEISLMADKCTNGSTTTVGALKVLGKADIEAIYRLAAPAR